MKNESTLKIVTVALGVCLVCSILVATTAVLLRPVQQQNQEKDKLINILRAAGLVHGEPGDIQTLFRKHIRAEIIHLEKGLGISPADLEEALKPDQFDIQKISRNPRFCRLLASEEDPAQIKYLPKYMIAYHVMHGDSITKRILPVYGKGLWSTMYGFLALGPDLNTIEAFTIYEHGETPGLGGEVDNPGWKQNWIRKQAFDEQGMLKIEVVKGRVDVESSNAIHQIDGLSGATLTTRGVHALVRFWLGDLGWGPYIRNAQNPSTS